MNLLKNSWTYLVGNLEYTEDGHQWREQVANNLSSLGVKCFDPNKEHFVNQPSEDQKTRNKLKEARAAGNWDFVCKEMRAIVRRDLRYVDSSNFIICRLEPQLPTFGTTWELCEAARQRKPVLFYLKDKTEFPMWFAGIFNMDLVFENWPQMFSYLIKIDRGDIYADPKYWKILINE